MRHVTRKLMVSIAVLLTVIVIKLVYDALHQFDYKSQLPILTYYYHTRLLRRIIIQMFFNRFYIKRRCGYMQVILLCLWLQFLPTIFYHNFRCYRICQWCTFKLVFSINFTIITIVHFSSNSIILIITPSCISPLVSLFQTFIKFISLSAEFDWMVS